jgi:hypothetical protein
VRLQLHVRAAIDRIDERAWTTLADYPPTSIAQIAEAELNGRRLVVRRVRTLDRQGELLPSWQLYPFATNRTEPLELVESEHRQHAVVELAIRDPKDQALAHFPSGEFFANAAWTVIACIAHNLLRWTSVLGLPGQTIRAARTLRRRLLALPGRLTRPPDAGRCTCRPAGPGSTPLTKRWHASERSRPPPDSSAHRFQRRRQKPRRAAALTAVPTPSKPVREALSTAARPAGDDGRRVDAVVIADQAVRAPLRPPHRWIEAKAPFAGGRTAAARHGLRSV